MTFASEETEVHKLEVSQAPERGAQGTATDSPFSHRSDPARMTRPPTSSNWSRDVTLSRESQSPLLVLASWKNVIVYDT